MERHDGKTCHGPYRARGAVGPLDSERADRCGAGSCDMSQSCNEKRVAGGIFI